MEGQTHGQTNRLRDLFGPKGQLSENKTTNLDFNVLLYFLNMTNKYVPINQKDLNIILSKKDVSPELNVRKKKLNSHIINIIV